MSKQDQLNNLKKEIVKQFSFSNQGKNFVFYRGNIESKIVIIGEAPGEKENEDKIPFSNRGKAGNKLNKALKNICNLNKEDIYVTNIIKYRPTTKSGNNRTPSNFEINEYIPFLKKELQIIKPNVILSLGNVATKSLLKIYDSTFLDSNFKLTNFVNQKFQFDKIFILTSYHPIAYVKKNEFEKSFYNLNEFLKKIN